MRFGTFVLSLSSRNRKDNVGVKFTNLPGGVLFDLDQSSQNPPSSKRASVYGRRKTGRCEKTEKTKRFGELLKGADGETDEKRRCGHRKE